MRFATPLTNNDSPTGGELNHAKALCDAVFFAINWQGISPDAREEVTDSFCDVIDYLGELGVEEPAKMDWEVDPGLFQLYVDVVQVTLNLP